MYTLGADKICTKTYCRVLYLTHSEGKTNGVLNKLFYSEILVMINKNARIMYKLQLDLIKYKVYPTVRMYSTNIMTIS